MPVGPPPAIVTCVASPAEIAGRAPLAIVQDPQPPMQIPDVRVEVVGELPVRTKLTTVSRLLGRRQAQGSFNRRYPPTILELIMLVERRPARPRGRNWDSIHALTIRYHPEPDHILVEYCIDYCDFDPQTGAFHPKRKMVSYRATAALVEKRLDKKIGELQRYEERRPPQGR